MCGGDEDDAVAPEVGQDTGSVTSAWGLPRFLLRPTKAQEVQGFSLPAPRGHIPQIWASLHFPVLGGREELL